MSNPPSRPQPPSTGLNILDMAGLTTIEKTIMRIVLRKVKISYADLLAAIRAQLGDNSPAREEIDAALAGMIEKTYIKRAGKGDQATFSLNLQRVSGFKSMDVQLGHGAASSMVMMWTALGTLEELETKERDAGRAVQDTVTAWKKKLSNFVRSSVGAQTVIILMILLAVVNRIVLSMVEVVAWSGFLTGLQTSGVPWLNIADMVAGVLISGTYLSLIDHMPRVRLVKILLGGFGAIYLLIAVAFFFLKSHGGVVTNLLFALIYLLRAQQVLVFPIAFWNLANSIYTMSEAKRVFPRMVAGETIGALIGYGIFSVPPLIGLGRVNGSANADILLASATVLMFLVLLLVQSTLKEPEEIVESEKRPSFIESLRGGWQIIREVKLFRYMAVTVMFVWFVFAIFGYYFLVQLDATQKFDYYYSLYNIISTLVFLLLQIFVTGQLIKRVATRNAFIALPVALLASAVAAFFPPALWTGITAYFIGYAVYSAWDAPSFTALQNLIPEERRGLVTALVINYSYAVGTILGSLLLGLIIWLPKWFPAITLPDTTATLLYLGLAVIAAGFAIFGSVLVRRDYEESMLSWRLSRRQRSSSVFDKLDF
jgi:ATP:ADP antiporter, AAA family